MFEKSVLILISAAAADFPFSTFPIVCYTVIVSVSVQMAEISRFEACCPLHTDATETERTGSS